MKRSKSASPLVAPLDAQKSKASPRPSSARALGLSAFVPSPLLSEDRTAPSDHDVSVDGQKARGSTENVFASANKYEGEDIVIDVKEQHGVDPQTRPSMDSIIIDSEEDIKQALLSKKLKVHSERVMEELDQNAILVEKRQNVPLQVANGMLYSFIDSIERGGLITDVITTSMMAEISASFVMSLYQDKAHGTDAFFFAHQDDVNDAEIAFRRYRSEQAAESNFYCHLVPVPDLDKFVQLAGKTSAGCATKKNGKLWNDFKVVYDTDYLYEEKSDYKMLPEERVLYASRAPDQNKDKKNGDWSCGPNTAYRALRLLGGTDEYMGINYNSFVEKCPKTFVKKTVKKGAKVSVGAGFATFIGSALLVPATGGLSAIGAAAGMGAVVGGAAAHGEAGTVGPKPAALAKYMNNYLDTNEIRARHACADNVTDDHIYCDIDLGFPRIVLFIMATNSMHYMNVIGYKKNGKKKVEEYVLMDTSGKIGRMARDRLWYWMDNDCAKILFMSKNNTVELDYSV